MTAGSWVENTDKRYWFPDTVPTKTDEWNIAQERKRYVTNYGTTRTHPRWLYDNGAFVDDDYLYHNEEWRYVTNWSDVPTSSDIEFYIKDPIAEWTKSEDDKTYTITWKTYAVKEPTISDEDTVQLKVQKEDTDWVYDHSALTVTKAYDITRYNTDDLNTEKWNVLRGTRDLLMKNTDWIITQGTERGVGISTAMKTYRQTLRDLPSTISDISAHTRSEIASRDFYPAEPSAPYFY
tara:strand:+ start:1500 stop:2207 length:708 start_codon:yes stop_codon:yes gene_type:complete